MPTNTNSQPDSSDLQPTLLQINLNDEPYKALAGYGSRLVGLLGNTEVRSDADAIGSLDDLLGAVYSLIFAKHYHFVDRPDRAIEIDAIRKRAEQIQRGVVRIDGKWMAGWHFNNGLFRVAAVYHRLLKVASGQPDLKRPMAKLLLDVKIIYRQWTGADWINDHAQVIYEEVNTLKHTPEGVYSARKATFDDAIAGIDELLRLVDAWSRSSPK
jgi:hypothetical protein